MTHLLAKDLIAQLNDSSESEVTELTSSIVEETALAILKRQGSRGITIVCCQSKMRFDIQVDPYWQRWRTNWSQLAAKDFETSEFHKDIWNRYLRLGFVSAHNASIFISDLELRRWYKALHDDLVLPSATTLSKICQWEYALTKDAIKKQLPSQSKVTLALDGWTSMNKLDVMLVFAYLIDRNWALHEFQLFFNEIDHLFLSHFVS